MNLLHGVLYLPFVFLAACLPQSSEPLPEKEMHVNVGADLLPDYEREQRMADEIVGVILDGEAVWLEAGGRPFLSLDTLPDDESKGAVIILHGRGFHPDWGDTINPLRVGLPEQGWRTLSMQMPVLKKSAKYYEYVPLFQYSHARIEAGIQYLRDQGEKKIVLLAHSCGAHMAMDWVAAKGDEKIDAYIGVGMGATDFQQPMRVKFPLAKMKVPVLDVYGQDEYPAVIKLAPERRAMLVTAGNKFSGQVIVPDADHYFEGKGGVLKDIIAEWLSRQ